METGGMGGGIGRNERSREDRLGEVDLKDFRSASLASARASLLANRCRTYRRSGVGLWLPCDQILGFFYRQ